MIKCVKIKNFKSIKDMEVEVGQFNVIIGENGAGKSNFAEALTVFGAIEDNKMDKGLLQNRGVRVLQGRSLVSKFGDSNFAKIQVTQSDQPDFPDGFVNEISLGESDEAYSKIGYSYKSLKYHWMNFFMKEELDSFLKENSAKEKSDKADAISDFLGLAMNPESDIGLRVRDNTQNKIYDPSGLGLVKGFLIYSPEYSILREEVVRDVVVEPLGVKGDGLLKLLSYMKENEQDAFKDVLECASMFSWVSNIEVCDLEQISGNSDSKITIIDKYINEKIFYKIANEGLLFVLFYAAVFCSKQTPRAFAIDNIDASLNPKMCRVLTGKLVSLAKKYNKQVFVTTHNPAVLDGLNLHDDDQRLFVAQRNDLGHSLLERVTVDDLPKPTRSGQTITLGEAFMRGHLGALPKNF